MQSKLRNADTTFDCEFRAESDDLASLRFRGSRETRFAGPRVAEKLIFRREKNKLADGKGKKRREIKNLKIRLIPEGRQGRGRVRSIGSMEPKVSLRQFPRK